MAHTFDEARHLFMIDGVPAPSITGIMSAVNITDISKIPIGILKKAAERGTFVHRYCEILDGGEAPERMRKMDEWIATLGETNENGELIYPWLGTTAEECRPYVEAYRKFLVDKSPAWAVIEKPMVYEDNISSEVYGGIPDRIGRMAGEDNLSVVDIKTSAKLYGTEGIQLAAQAILYANQPEAATTDGDTPWRVATAMPRYILHLKKDGTYDLVPYDSLHDYDWWMQALGLFTGLKLTDWRKKVTRDPSVEEPANDWSWL
jgi:hypothetical protein